MTLPVVLFCKTYRTDLRRLARLAESVQKHNRDHIPFFVSVPTEDLPLFRSHLPDARIEWLTDSQIISASVRIRPEQVAAMPGGMAQQVVKSEFWRLGISPAFLCLDADAYFIRPFGLNDFCADDGVPYTVMDQAHDLLEAAIEHDRLKVLHHFFQESERFQQRMGRRGPHYNFGPLPVVWHRDVWQSLDQEYLQPRGMSFADAIQEDPIETRWYGEALLKYQAIPLRPVQSLFKVYHYAWQYDADQRRAGRLKQLDQLYSGIILQSSWDKPMDWPTEPGTWSSKLARRIRRQLGRM